MKNLISSFVLVIALCIVSAYGQTTYYYLLADDLKADLQEAPELIVIPNNGGLTGSFVNRTVPVSTCEEGGNADGYFFEDDAGLQFDNPELFIDCDYTLQMIFQVDEFESPPSWVRLLSFTHGNDVGVYIKLTNPPTNGTLEFWPFGTVGETDFFTTEDFYQLTLVRDCSGMIKIYINGSEFSSYDDAFTQAYLPQDPDNRIVFFRDDPSVLADEASPGFVSNLVIADYPWTEQQIMNSWENFCPTLLAIEDEIGSDKFVFGPVPAESSLFFDWKADDASYIAYVIDLDSRMRSFMKVKKGINEMTIEELEAGFYLLWISDGYNIVSRKFVKK